jgi:hypothetical protein
VQRDSFLGRVMQRFMSRRSWVTNWRGDMKLSYRKRNWNQRVKTAAYMTGMDKPLRYDNPATQQVGLLH